MGHSLPVSQHSRSGKPGGIVVSRQEFSHAASSYAIAIARARAQGS